MKIETIEIAGLAGALTALRLPFGKEVRSEIETRISDMNAMIAFNIVSYAADITINDKDLTLMQTLVKRGDEHAKVVRGIMVWAKITATRKWWSESDTYRQGRERLASRSTMHELGQRPLSVDDFEVSDFVRECLTPTPAPSSNNTTLHFDVPEKLECRVLTMYGRDYEVWNNGDIYAMEFVSEDKMPNGKIRRRTFPKTKLKLGYTKTSNGYFQVGIGGRKGKIEMIHRIMAMAFVPNPDNKPFVNHIDGDKGNCSPTNLEWCTSAENNAHARETGLANNNSIRARYLQYKSSRKFTEEEIMNWKIMKAGGMTYEEIAEHTGVSKSAIENYILYDGCFKASDNTYEFRQAYKLEEDINYINTLMYNETKDAEILNDIKDALPEGYLQTRVDTYSYQTLRRIVAQRHDHRLPEWHQFIDWIKTLPLAEELILVGLEDRREIEEKAKRFDMIMDALENAESVNHFTELIKSMFTKEE